MRRLLTVMALTLALIIPMFAFGTPHIERSNGPQKHLNVSWEELTAAMAESGCSSSANTPYRSNGWNNGSTSFSCGADYGNRVIQACIIVGGTWWDCDTAYPTSYGDVVTAECHYYGGAYQSAVTWGYFRGEDGSEWSGYGHYTQTYPCDYGVD